MIEKVEPCISAKTQTTLIIVFFAISVNGQDSLP